MASLESLAVHRYSKEITAFGADVVFATQDAPVGALATATKCEPLARSITVNSFGASPALVVEYEGGYRDTLRPAFAGQIFYGRFRAVIASGTANLTSVTVGF